ncbi:NAD(P)/FAD-dependent oxidoreductase [Auraticoccus monumenti]|uniref:Reductase C-terminal n=1 Tax=Auraticoccus monumenti TaxID=675864 RepID=A0A1G6UWD6_9ACTN|nr:FAD-dependent oxidoreductase [Auraticoccus monumenti]SDD45583.1 Reductase C-terminal [Auraticoccus monumenti]
MSAGPVEPLQLVRGRVAVVGGGLAAVSLVQTLRAGGFVGALSVLEAGPEPHDRPPLSKAYLAGRLGPDQLALVPPTWWAEQSVDLRTGVRVEGLVRQADGSLVVLADGAEVPADRVVLASGGRPRRPPVPGAEHALVLRDRVDADVLRDRLGPGHRLVVVGGGLVGSEVAATALTLGCQVTVVDPQVPLTALLGHELAVWLHLLHRERGVVLVADGVDRIESGSVHVPGAVIPADTVLVATGLLPEVPVVGVVPAGVEAGTPEAVGAVEVLTRTEDGAVLVDEAGRSSVPGVLAVGDCSGRSAGGRSAGHWDSARLDAEAAAAGLLGLPLPVRGPSWFWSDRHGHHLEVLGAPAAAEQLVTRGVVGEPPFSCFGLTGGRVVSAASVDDPAAVKVARRLAALGTAVDPAALADPATDLRRLARAR